MDSPKNKVLNTKKAATASVGTAVDVKEQDYMFPCAPTPVVIKAKTMDEALEKFEAYKNNN